MGVAVGRGVGDGTAVVGVIVGAGECVEIPPSVLKSGVGEGEVEPPRRVIDKGEKRNPTASSIPMILLLHKACDFRKNVCLLRRH